MIIKKDNLYFGVFKLKYDKQMWEFSLKEEQILTKITTVTYCVHVIPDPLKIHA